MQGNIIKFMVNLVENELLLSFSHTFVGGEDSLLQSHSEHICSVFLSIYYHVLNWLPSTAVLWIV